jgi:ABC-type nickel/cobalt efflux system permease component RcnA
MIGTLLALGFVLGVKHALEADHVAAVAALAKRSATLGERARLGSAWGVGHALTLFAVGALVLLAGIALPPAAAPWFEAAVGVLLVALGVDVLRRLRRERVHFHAHRHGDGALHLHAHAHAAEEARYHDPDRHEHAHPSSALARALLVGGVHGLAGSAALVLIATEAAATTAQAFVHLSAFSLGTIVGMTALSLAISFPLRVSASRLAPFSRVLQGALGLFSIAFGLWIAIDSLRVPISGGGLG